VAETRGKSAGGKRERLVAAAVELAHRQGYRATTLAHLAEEADVPLGNIYYYFKTKEEIGNAILEQRKCDFAAMRERLAGIATPQGRLIAFVEMSIANAPMVAERGCPMGSLTADMLKDDGELASKANVLLAGPMAWMAEQFAEMGRGAEADDLALQLQSSLQGASMLAHALGDAAPLEREGRRLIAWLEQLG
jgi:TetR/AcrR family transcriptional regulator, transcriptional repressor for nem operon